MARRRGTKALGGSVGLAGGLGANAFKRWPGPGRSRGKALSPFAAVTKAPLFPLSPGKIVGLSDLGKSVAVGVAIGAVALSAVRAAQKRSRAKESERKTGSPRGASDDYLREHNIKNSKANGRFKRRGST